MRKLLLAVLITLVCSVAAFGQKGTAEPGYYPQNYFGDTWTGAVTSVNEETREFTLTYKKKDKDETFVGVLPVGYMQKMADGSEREIKLADLMGVTHRAYYMSKSKNTNGQKTKYNEVFKIRILALAKP